MSGWGWPLMGLGFLFWVLVIIAIIAFVRALDHPRQYSPPAPPESPLDTLDRRYARGEITREQYQQMREDLQRRGPP